MLNDPRTLLALLLISSACSGEKIVQPERQYVLNIKVDAPAVSDQKKTDMVLYPSLSDTTSQYEGWIERRGGYSISFPKHSYEIDLDVDLPLGGLPADDDWILNANYIDKTFLRHVFSYELFRAMHPNNLAPLTRYITLYINSEYVGLYVLMQKLDRSSLAIDKRDPTAFIFKEPPVFRPDWTTFVPQHEDNFFQQVYPKKEKVDKTPEMDSIRQWLLHSSDTLFEKEVNTVFDLANIVDWHLLLLLSNNSDGILKNFYLYKASAATPIRIAPWDYDHSFGRDGDNELNLIRPLRMEISILFKRLLTLPSYQKALQARWEELNHRALFTPDALKQRMADLIEQFRPLLEGNFERWPVDDSRYYDDNDFAAEIAIMEQFIDLRHEQLQNYFSGEE